MAESFFHQAVPILCVRDLEQAIEFYGRIGFSLTVRFEQYALLACECIQLHLRIAEDMDPTNNPCGAYFYLDGVDAFACAVTAEGVTLLERPSDRTWRMRECSISDPDGNLLRFGEHLGESPYPRTEL